MIDGREIGKILNDAHSELYGINYPKNSFFYGGNVGLAILGLCILKASENIAAALSKISYEEKMP